MAVMERHALIAGVSGIIGRHVAEHLIATKGWTVTGISRHKHDLPKGVKHISIDLRSDEAVNAALRRTKVTDVFITTWLRQPTEAENCRVNARRSGMSPWSPAASTTWAHSRPMRRRRW
jgi:nucleoside-diphosphate-sugar epimerase